LVRETAETGGTCQARAVLGYKKTSPHQWPAFQHLASIEFGQRRRERSEVFVARCTRPRSVQVLQLRGSTFGIRYKKVVDPLDLANGPHIGLKQAR
jgi:hypothetical protein